MEDSDATDAAEASGSPPSNASPADDAPRPPQLSRMQVASATPAGTILIPRNQPPLPSLMRGATTNPIVAAETASPSVPNARSNNGNSAAAATANRAPPRPPRRNRSSVLNVRFQPPAMPPVTENGGVAIYPSYPRHASPVALSRRRQSSRRECAAADARLATKFPSVAVRALSAVHLVICLLVLFVQFWTSTLLQAEYHWVRSVNTYGYMCALLSGLAGCSGIALYLQQSKIRAMSFLGMSVSAAFISCYLLTFYTTYFAEIRMFVSAQGCIEKYNKHPNYRLPFLCMTILALVEFFAAFVSVVITSTIINRARACWWSCDPCTTCQIDEDLEAALDEEAGEGEEEESRLGDLSNSPFQFAPPFEMPPSYSRSLPPPYKP